MSGTEKIFDFTLMRVFIFVYIMYMILDFGKIDIVLIQGEKFVEN